jgi:hypothetical protein
MVKEYMSELICGFCAYTGYVTWDSTGADRKVVDQSTHIKLDPGNPATFACLKCGAEQELEQ